jgi:ENTS family enterobactin (siderophore) exporter
VPLLLDVTPLRTPAYRRLWLGMAATGVGTQLTLVAVGLQVYDLTGSTVAVGLVGLVTLVPLVTVGILGGSVVDAVDRRRVIVLSTVATFLLALAFAAQAAVGLEDVWLLYLLAAAQSGLFGLTNPARSASVPRLLPVDQLPAANALTSLSFGITMAAGPVLAGVLVAEAGFAAAYGADAVLVGAAVLTLRGLPAMAPDGPVRPAGLASVVEGFRFLGTRPNVRLTFLVDLAAMVLAMPRVLLPAVAVLAVGGGAVTVGLLAACFALGTAAAGLLSGPLGSIRHQGRAVVVAIVVYGAAVAAFGVFVAISPGPGEGGSPAGLTEAELSDAAWTLWPLAGCLMVAGAADAVSAVFRMTILQAATPDALRGRLQGVFTAVVAGGPRLGDVVLGTVAGLATEAVAATGGGLACIVVVVVLAASHRGFLRYDARDPQP